MKPVALQAPGPVSRPAVAGPATRSTGNRKQVFSEVLHREHVPGVASPAAGGPSNQAAAVLGRLEAGRQRLDQIIAQARAGRTFTAGELLAMQAEVYRVSEQFNLAVKVTEQVSSGLKRLWHLQV